MCTSQLQHTAVAQEMELLWVKVQEMRAEAIELLDSEVPCNDPRLVELSSDIQSCGLQLADLWKIVKLHQHI